MSIYDSSDPESYREHSTAAHRAPEPAGESQPVTGGPAGLGPDGTVAVTTPTTDVDGQPTGKPQNKIVAVLTGSAGATIVAAVISQLVGIDLDPVTSTLIAGGIASLIGTLAGYLRPNRSDAN